MHAHTLTRMHAVTHTAYIYATYSHKYTHTQMTIAHTLAHKLIKILLHTAAKCDSPIFKRIHKRCNSVTSFREATITL